MTAAQIAKNYLKYEGMKAFTKCVRPLHMDRPRSVLVLVCVPQVQANRGGREGCELSFGSKVAKNRTAKLLKIGMWGGWPAELKPKAPLSPLLFSVAPLHHKGSAETFAGVLDQISVQNWLAEKRWGGNFALRGRGEGGDANQNQD